MSRVLLILLGSRGHWSASADPLPGRPARRGSRLVSIRFHPSLRASNGKEKATSHLREVIRRKVFHHLPLPPSCLDTGSHRRSRPCLSFPSEASKPSFGRCFPQLCDFPGSDDKSSCGHSSSLVWLPRTLGTNIRAVYSETGRSNLEAV